MITPRSKAFALIATLIAFAAYGNTWGKTPRKSKSTTRSVIASPKASVADSGTGSSSEIGSISQADLQWALGLEQRVKSENYRPTEQEHARYEEIAQRLSEVVQNAPERNTGASETNGATVPDADLQWAMEIERRVQEGHQPSADEILRYRAIATGLQAEAAADANTAGKTGENNAGPANASKISEADIQWAVQLQQRVTTGSYQPTPEEVARYTDIYQRLQSETPAKK